MSDVKQALAMLHMAEKDLNALLGMEDNPLFAEEIFGFHAQQAAEKSLKAWLCVRGLAYPPTHDLSRLLTLLENSGADVAAYWPLDQYTLFAVQARYELGVMEHENPLNRRAVIEEIRALFRHVAAQMDSIDSEP
jgi:HEPN domain-containing protein